jgi:hypothetical protein
MTDDTKTMDLPLPLRTRNALEKHNLKDWKTVKAANLLDVPGLGSKGLDAIQALWTAEEQADVDDIATQVEMSQVEPTTPEESIARRVVRQDVVEKVGTAMQQRLDDAADYTMRGGLESLGKRAVVEEIRQRTEAFRARGGTIETGVGLLALRLESDLQARIGALIPTIKALPHVKELGVDVDEKVVARMALIRGLESLEKTNGQPVAAKPTKAEPSQEDAPVVPTMQDGERYATPDGWNKQPPGEAVPASQVDVHSYYAAYGWERYWGKVDSTTFYFYWCPEKLNQDVAPFPNGDKGGRKITVQQTPWGPGHILPAGWNT